MYICISGPGFSIPLLTLLPSTYPKPWVLPRAVDLGGSLSMAKVPPIQFSETIEAQQTARNMANLYVYTYPENN